jgi:hypothetical protein
MSSKNCNVDVVKYFLVQPDTGDVYNCSGTTFVNNIDACDPLSGVTINNAITVFPTEIIPLTDDQVNLGSPIRRFREINVVSGSSTIWTATTIYSPEINLGFDSNNELRIINADNSVIQDDTLNGGIY